MSYEGYYEYICVNGHRYTYDCYAAEMTGNPSCPFCKAEVEFIHSVDETNGEVEGDPSTYRARIKTLRLEDEEHRDYIGNRYFTQREIVAPDSPEWGKKEEV